MACEKQCEFTHNNGNRNNKQCQTVMEQVGAPCQCSSPKFCPTLVQVQNLSNWGTYIDMEHRAGVRGEVAPQLRARAGASLRAGQGADLRPRGIDGGIQDDTRDEVGRLRSLFLSFGEIWIRFTPTEWSNWILQRELKY